MRLRPQAVVALLLMLIWTLVWFALPGFDEGRMGELLVSVGAFGGALALALYLWLRAERSSVEHDGVRLSHQLIFEKDVPFEAIVDARTEAHSGHARLVLLGMGGLRLGAVSAPNAMEAVLDALRARRSPDALSDLARPDKATVSEWRSRLDARAKRLTDASYRASPDADIEVLAATMTDESCALDVRAGAGYVLAQSGVERAIDRVKIALENAPPLAIALVRTAHGGAALVTHERAKEALRVVSDADAELLDRPHDEEAEQDERHEHR
jgi:hypothetical protein